MRRAAVSAKMLAIPVLAAAFVAAYALPPPWFDRALLAVSGFVLFNLMRLVGVRTAPAALCVLAGTVAGAVLMDRFEGLRFTPYVMILVINLGLGLIFARGLLPAREPILIQLIREMSKQAVLPAPFRGFVRQQCLFWAVLCAATALVSTLAMLSPAVRPVADKLLIVLLIGQVGLFILSHWYARWRYARPERWWETIAAMSRPATWAALRL